MTAQLASHDPGGKTRIRLPDGVTGDAKFSECGRYRHLLTRDWTMQGMIARSILFVGLNPSVAAADVSDPTCHRETVFAMDWGFTRFLKANVMDWRATAPTDIPKDPAVARSPDNIPTLIRLADEAEVIVMATGNVPPRFHALYDETLDVLRKSAKPLKCLGHNKSGMAKHPLYIRKDAPLIPF